MNLGKVVGTVVATQKESSLEGLKFLLVKHVDTEGKETGGQVVAVDAIGVGPGELVLIATGSSARQTAATKDRPCDAVIMAIVLLCAYDAVEGMHHEERFTTKYTKENEGKQKTIKNPIGPEREREKGSFIERVGKKVVDFQVDCLYTIR